MYIEIDYSRQVKAAEAHGFCKALPHVYKALEERDEAAQAFSQAYYLVTGRSPKWSDTFGYEDALEEIKEHCGIMRNALASRSLP